MAAAGLASDRIDVGSAGAGAGVGVGAASAIDATGAAVGVDGAGAASAAAGAAGAGVTIGATTGAGASRMGAAIAALLQHLHHLLWRGLLQINPDALADIVLTEPERHRAGVQIGRRAEKVTGGEEVEEIRAPDGVGHQLSQHAIALYSAQFQRLCALGLRLLVGQIVRL